jgi:hypothetical protein
VLLLCCMRSRQTAHDEEKERGFAERCEREQGPLKLAAPQRSAPPPAAAAAPSEAGTPRSRRIYTHVGEERADELPPKLAAALGVPVRKEQRGTYPPPFAPCYDTAAPPPRGVVRWVSDRAHHCALLLVADAALPCAVRRMSKVSPTTPRSDDGELSRKM